MEEKIVNWTFTAMEMLAELHEYLSGFSEGSADKGPEKNKFLISGELFFRQARRGEGV